MQILIWSVRLVVVLLVVWFAAKNADPVTLHGYLDAEWKAPLVLFLLAFFAIGLVLGLGVSLVQMLRLKREVRQLNRVVQRHRRDHAHAAGEPPLPSAQPPLGGV